MESPDLSQTAMTIRAIFDILRTPSTPRAPRMPSVKSIPLLTDGLTSFGSFRFLQSEGSPWRLPSRLSRLPPKITPKPI